MAIDGHASIPSQEEANLARSTLSSAMPPASNPIHPPSTPPCNHCWKCKCVPPCPHCCRCQIPCPATPEAPAETNLAGPPLSFGPASSSQPSAAYPLLATTGAATPPESHPSAPAATTPAGNAAPASELTKSPLHPLHTKPSLAADGALEGWSPRRSPNPHAPVQARTIAL